MATRSGSQKKKKAPEAVKEKPLDLWLGLASIAVGIIFFLLPRNPLIVVGSLVTVLLLLVHPVWNFWWIEKSYTRRVTTLLLLTGILVLFGVGVWPEAPPKTKNYATTLLVRYSLSALPLSVDAGSTAYVLQINPNIAEGLWEVKNNSQHAFTWPRDINPKKTSSLPELIYACELTNHGDKALLDVILVFEKRFYEPKKIGQSERKKNPDGTYSFSFPGPPKGDTSSFADSLSGDVFTEGVLLKSVNHQISIPAIASKQTIKVYLINQSRFIGRFTFPKEATAVAAGEADRVKVSLIRPRINVADAIPWYSLAPARYKWVGVSDAS